jgi:hypothetical protein
MASKWLTWQPGSEGFAGASMGENPIIQSHRGRDSAVPSASAPAIIENFPREPPSKPTKPLPLDSEYAELACKAMQRIAEVCPPGALKWAREAHPDLTGRIDVQLIPRLNDLWGTHAPLPGFQAALDELVRLHEDIGKLFATETNLRRA